MMIETTTAAANAAGEHDFALLGATWPSEIVFVVVAAVSDTNILGSFVDGSELRVDIVAHVSSSTITIRIAGSLNKQFQQQQKCITIKS